MRDKITSLFEYRMLPEIVASCSGNDNTDLFERLYKLQEAIYYLDHHLETNWSIDQIALAPFWADINSILKTDFGVDADDIHDYISDILQYQTHELDLRQGKLPIAHDPFHFYYFKSCDVKLIRRLISEHIPAVLDKYPLEIWKNFDLITELNDDVEDIFEDLETINGNAVLIALHEVGFKEAKSYVHNFLDAISIANEADRSSGKIPVNIIDATQDQIIATRELLEKNLSQLQSDKSALDEAKLFKLIKIFEIS